MCESERGRLPAHDLWTAILMPSPSPNEEFSLHPTHVEPLVLLSSSQVYISFFQGLSIFGLWWRDACHPLSLAFNTSAAGLGWCCAFHN